MRTSLVRLVAVPAAMAVAAIMCTASPASAEPDPVTGGTTTLHLSLDAAFGPESDIVVAPVAPATLTEPAEGVSDFASPVTGGDASVRLLFGSLNHAGGLVITNTERQRSLTFTDLTFTIQDDTISATTPASPTPVVLFDVLGSHDASSSPQPETFTGSDLQLNRLGARFLRKKLHSQAFTAHLSVGTFATSFTNTVDG